MRWGRLRTRILLLAIGLVTGTALAVGLGSVQFARSAARAEQRGELSAQASLLTLQSVHLVRPAALRRVARRLDGTVVSVYAPSGALLATTAASAAAPVVRRTRSIAEQAVAGGSITTAIRLRTGDVLVEARASADGGAIVLTRRLAALTGTTAGLLVEVLMTLAICLALAALAAVLLARRIAAPLAATGSAARRLALGERGIPVPHTSLQEVEDVAGALRSLDIALTTSEARQREFLLSVSHEIRTPLTALRGYGEALLDGLVPPARMRQVGGTLVAETGRIEAFTRDLLELARLEADDFSVEPQRVDLTAVVAEAVAAWRGRAEAAEVDLVAAADAPVPARADPRRARQVLDGLLENALRATPAGGTVLVSAGTTDRGAAVAVEDSGPGLSAEDLAEAFTRGLLRERYRETRDVGTGLGLSIATRLAARMGGRITADHAEGHPGARFTLELPSNP